MKFLLDMPVSPNLEKWLGIYDHQAIHAKDCGLSTATDIMILEKDPRRKPNNYHHRPGFWIFTNAYQTIKTWCDFIPGRKLFRARDEGFII